MSEQRPAGDSAAEAMTNLPDRGKAPASARVLDAWINQAQQKLGMDAGRLGWLIASTVVVAALQRAVDATGRSLFLLKGGTCLLYRMSRAGRPTKDIDGLVRGDMNTFLDALDQALGVPWGPMTLTRSEPEVIASPARVVKPRRFDVWVSLRGRVWRRVQVEIASDEAGAGDEQDVLTPPGLAHFGLPDPDFLVGIALRYQIAQKIHACTDPHDPPDERNDRARDVVDLLLLRDLAATEGAPSLAQLREACVALFAARATDARTLSHTQRVATGRGSTPPLDQRLCQGRPPGRGGRVAWPGGRAGERLDRAHRGGPPRVVQPTGSPGVEDVLPGNCQSDAEKCVVKTAEHMCSTSKAWTRRAPGLHV